MNYRGKLDTYPILIYFYVLFLSCDIMTLLGENVFTKCSIPCEFMRLIRRKYMKKKWIILLLIVIAVVAGGGYFWYQKSHAPQKDNYTVV